MRKFLRNEEIGGKIGAKRRFLADFEVSEIKKNVSVLIFWRKIQNQFFRD